MYTSYSFCPQPGYIEQCYPLQMGKPFGKPIEASPIMDDLFVKHGDFP